MSTRPVLRSIHSRTFAVIIQTYLVSHPSVQALANSNRSLPFSIRNARKLSAPVLYFGNAAGIALYEKFGFEIEGTHPRFAFRGGEYVDAYSMARVRN